MKSVELTQIRPVDESYENVNSISEETNQEPGRRKEEYKPDTSEDEDEARFEYINQPDTTFTNSVKSIQDSLIETWKSHKRIFKRVFWIIVLILYIVYFIFAILHKFGDEGSIRLVWVTCMVVLCTVLYYVWQYVADNVMSAMQPSIEKHGKKINWTILGLLYVFIIVYVVVDATVLNDDPYNLVSFSGIILYVILLFIFSKHPAYVSWRAVLWGLALQFVFALVIMRTCWGYAAFKWLGDRVNEFLSHTNAGAVFVFGDMYVAHYFAFQVLSVIIFFSAMISIFYYVGCLQPVIKAVAWVMQICMGTTAGESFNAAGNIFCGSAETPLMIRPMLNDLTSSELHAVLTGGYATAAGSVFAAYIFYGIPANHIIAASVMSAPAALAMSKLLYPETKKSRTTASHMRNLAPSTDSNLVEAACSGATASISLVANIAANLIAFIAVLHFINATLTWFGHRVGLMAPEHEDLTLQFIFSYLLFPFALVMGVEIPDCRKVAGLVGVKVIVNDIVAYNLLGEIGKNMEFHSSHLLTNGSVSYIRDSVVLIGGAHMVNESIRNDGVILNSLNHVVFEGNDAVLTLGVLSERSYVIATYALCGFAHITAMGIQLGVLGSLAPRRKRELTKMVLSAMIAGNVACFMTAAIAGLFYRGNDNSLDCM